jgi:hypothetical protein
VDPSSAWRFAFREGGVIRMQMRDEDVTRLEAEVLRFACIDEDARAKQYAGMPSVARR